MKKLRNALIVLVSITLLLVFVNVVIGSNIEYTDSNETVDIVFRFAVSILCGAIFFVLWRIFAIGWSSLMEKFASGIDRTFLGLKKKFTFEAFCKRIDNSSVDIRFVVELSKEDAKRITYYGTKSDIYEEGFVNCDELSDLYSKIYEVAIDKLTDEIRERAKSGFAYEPEAEDCSWKVDDTYYCEVLFPKIFEEYIK